MNVTSLGRIDTILDHEEDIPIEEIRTQLDRAAEALQKSVFDLAGRIAPGDVSQLVLAAATVERIARRLVPEPDDLDNQQPEQP